MADCNEADLGASFDATYDAIIVGTGCAGLTAAVAAAKRHEQRVLVIEKSRYLGGTTAFANAGFWVPCHHHQQSQGIKDSKELATTYLIAVLGQQQYDEEMISSFLDNAPEAVRWIKENTPLHFSSSPVPDYHRDCKGALMAGRGLRNLDFDGRELGAKRLKDIRYVLR